MDPLRTQALRLHLPRAGIRIKAFDIAGAYCNVTAVIAPQEGSHQAHAAKQGVWIPVQLGSGESRRLGRPAVAEIAERRAHVESSIERMCEVFVRRTGRRPRAQISDQPFGMLYSALVIVGSW